MYKQINLQYVQYSFWILSSNVKMHANIEIQNDYQQNYQYHSHSYLQYIKIFFLATMSILVEIENVKTTYMWNENT